MQRLCDEPLPFPAPLVLVAIDRAAGAIEFARKVAMLTHCKVPAVQALVSQFLRLDPARLVTPAGPAVRR